MAFVVCCNKKRMCDAYKLQSSEGDVLSYAYYLEACPVCAHTSLVIRRIRFDGAVFEFRKTNEKARKLFDKLKSSILYKYPQKQPESGFGFYLKYNRYGVVQKCYSNLSSMQAGKFESLDLPNLPEKLPLKALCS